MIYLTAYDTTIGKTFNPLKSKAIRAIQESAVRDGSYGHTYGMVKESTKTIPWFIALQSESEAQIPFFNHPLLVDLVEKNEKALCVDIRTFATFNKNTSNLDNPDEALKIRNRIELSLAKLRMGLNLLWIDDRPVVLREISFVPMAIFSNWISESITKRFGLTAKEQFLISIVSCYYYYSLFSIHSELSPEERTRLLAACIKITRAPATMVEQTIEAIANLEPMESIKQLATNIKAITENSRLENFNEGLLVNLLISSWFGASARELVAVSLEHPPTWISLVYSAFVEKSFKNTLISKIAYRYLGPKGENDFIRSLVSLINEE